MFLRFKWNSAGAEDLLEMFGSITRLQRQNMNHDVQVYTGEKREGIGGNTSWERRNGHWPRCCIFGRTREKPRAAVQTHKRIKKEWLTLKQLASGSAKVENWWKIHHDAGKYWTERPHGLKISKSLLRLYYFGQPLGPIGWGDMPDMCDNQKWSMENLWHDLSAVWNLGCVCYW